MGAYWIPDAVLAAAKQALRIYQPKRDFDFGWWFNYFWKEARVNAPHEVALRRAVAGVLENVLKVRIPPQMTMDEERKYGNDVVFASPGPNAGYRRAWPPTDPPDDDALVSRAEHFRAQLIDLMEIGFKPMPLKRLASLPPEQAALMFRDIVQVPDGGAGRRPVAIAYRGESRPFDQVQQQGTTPRALLGAQIGMNVEQDWHPYSLPAVRSKWYARRTSGDNCLYTVNSVADAPSLSVGFPLIEDDSYYTVPDYHTADVLPVKAPRLALCRIGGMMARDEGVFMATESYLYAVRLDEGANTQAFVEDVFRIKKDQCVERATGEIAFERCLAGVRVLRIHKGPIRTSGIAGIVLERRYGAGGSWFTEAQVGSVPDLLAEAHFAKDQAAADQAAAVLTAAFGAPGTAKVIDGEWTSDVNPEGAVRIVQFERFLDLKEFKELSGRPSIYLAPPLGLPAAPVARPAPPARGVAQGRKLCPKCGQSFLPVQFPNHLCKA